jgi:hypothetical protein
LIGTNYLFKELGELFKVFDYLELFVLLLIYFTTFLAFLEMIGITGKYFLPPIIIASLFLIGEYFFPLKCKTL